MDGAKGRLIGTLAPRGRHHMLRHRKTFVCLRNFHCGALLQKSRMNGGPVGGIEHLTRLKNHLDDVFVSVGLGGLFRVCAKNKEIHLGLLTVGGWWISIFSF